MRSPAPPARFRSFRVAPDREARQAQPSTPAPSHKFPQGKGVGVILDSPAEHPDLAVAPWYAARLQQLAAQNFRNQRLVTGPSGMADFVEEKEPKYFGREDSLAQFG